MFLQHSLRVSGARVLTVRLQEVGIAGKGPLLPLPSVARASHAPVVERCWTCSSEFHCHGCCKQLGWNRHSLSWLQKYLNRPEILSFLYSWDWVVGGKRLKWSILASHQIVGSKHVFKIKQKHINLKCFWRGNTVSEDFLCEEGGAAWESWHVTWDRRCCRAVGQLLVRCRRAGPASPVLAVATSVRLSETLPSCWRICRMK